MRQTIHATRRCARRWSRRNRAPQLSRNEEPTRQRSCPRPPAVPPHQSRSAARTAACCRFAGSHRSDTSPHPCSPAPRQLTAARWSETRSFCHPSPAGRRPKTSVRRVPALHPSRRNGARTAHRSCRRRSRRRRGGMDRRHSGVRLSLGRPPLRPAPGSRARLRRAADRRPSTLDRRPRDPQKSLPTTASPAPLLDLRRSLSPR
jgi:hypothetical protein